MATLPHGIQPKVATFKTTAARIVSDAVVLRRKFRGLFVNLHNANGIRTHCRSPSDSPFERSRRYAIDQFVYVHSRVEEVVEVSDAETSARSNSNQLIDGRVDQQAGVLVQRHSANGHWGFSPILARHSQEPQEG